MEKVQMVNVDGKKIENNSAIWANHPDMGENVFVTGMIVPGMIVPEGYVAESMIQSDGIVMIRITPKV